MTMSMVAAAGNSPRFERLYGNAPAATGGVPSPDRPSRRDDDDQRAARGNDDGPGRRNPLVRALMQALQGLMPASAGSASSGAAPASAATSPEAPVSTTTADTPSSTAPAAASDTGTLKDAAVAFAHELFGALRGLGGEDRDGHRHHHGHHHHGHHHGHGRGRDYGDLAQGLRQLAQSIDTAPAQPAAATAPAALPAPQPVSTAPATPAPVVATPVNDAPLAAAPADAAPISGTAPVALSGGTNIEINIQIKIQLPGNTVAAAPATPAPAEESPLLAAFKRLMDKLAPGTGTGTATGAAATDGPSPAEKLRAFLNGIANALSGSPDAGATTRPAVGSLLSVAA